MVGCTTGSRLSTEGVAGAGLTCVAGGLLKEWKNALTPGWGNVVPREGNSLV